MNRQNATAFFVLPVLLLMAGCGGRPSADEVIREANKTNIQRVSNLYARHQLQNQTNGPTDESSFKEFIRGLDSGTLSRVGVDNSALDELFVSERDSEPFKIRYEVNASGREAGKAIVFEQTGVDGVRQVGFTSMEIREIDSDSEYEELFSSDDE